MEQRDFRERALELRGFINGYIVGRATGPAPHTKAMLAFLEDFLRAESELRPSDDIRSSPVEITPQGLETEDEPIVEFVPQADKAASAILDREEESDEAKVEAFLTARGQRQVPASPTPSGKKRREWSPEAREAARARMRAAQAARWHKKRQSEDGDRPPPVSVPQPVIVKRAEPRGEPDDSAEHEPEEVASIRDDLAVDTTLPVLSPANRWTPTPLSDEDWPDIRDMINAGSSREKVAGDYDVPVDVLEAFVDAKLGLTGAGFGPLPPGK